MPMVFLAPAAVFQNKIIEVLPGLKIEKKNLQIKSKYQIGNYRKIQFADDQAALKTVLSSM